MGQVGINIRISCAQSILVTILLTGCNPSNTKSSSTHWDNAAAASDTIEKIKAVVEQYFDSYMNADLDQMLATLDPAGPMYPGEISNIGTE
jgi:hypothetical protein